MSGIAVEGNDAAVTKRRQDAAGVAIQIGSSGNVPVAVNRVNDP